jgi:hypothetical protein
VITGKKRFNKMKFAGIEKDIQRNLDTLMKAESKGTLEPMQLCGYYDGAYEQSIINALRANGVLMKDFLEMALEEWEYIVTKLVGELPRYVRENLKDFTDIKEIGE